MLPDPRWDDAMSALYADRFIPQPCRCIELIAHKDDDVEVIARDLTADAVFSWLDGQVSQDGVRLVQYTDVVTFHFQIPTGQGSSPVFRTRLV